MKYILLVVTMLLSTNVYAEEIITEPIDTPIKIETKLINCTSSSNIWMSIDGKDTRINLLAYDKEDGNLNSEIDKYICDTLSNAKKIEIEYDEKITTTDKYNRVQVWLYVDDKLFQNELISKGYGQVNYILDDYKYLTELCNTQKLAISNSLGIWNYEGIKESYCKSGIKVGEKIEDKKDEETTIKRYDTKTIYLILVFSSGIVLLLLIMRGKHYEKR